MISPFPTGLTSLSSAWVGVVSLGVEQLIPVCSSARADIGLSLGLRMGYSRQLRRAGWTASPDGPALGREPDVDLSGVHVRFSLGYAVNGF